jgi:hypothetical protein
MSRVTSSGTCVLCGEELAKNRMTKHVAACAQKKGGRERSFHIVAEGRYAPEYWLHLDVRHRARLDDLDAFLRRTWLECCGHMSQFEIDGRQYLSQTYAPGQKTMAIALGDVLHPGLKFTHTYDFGTETELRLRVVAELSGAPAKGGVRLLARNRPPEFSCVDCGGSATDLCTQCSSGGPGWLCRRCGRKHECGEEMLLPVVNSPRVGQCAYTG